MGTAAESKSKQAMPNLFEFDDYRVFLKVYLSAKIEQNPRYSLRAFAKFLGISSTNLSAVLNGQREFSPDRMLLLAERLSFTNKQTEYFELLGKLSSTRVESVRSSLKKRLRKFSPRTPTKNMSSPQFRMIQGWKDFAVLISLRKNRSLSETPQVVEKSLGLKPFEYDIICDRLKKLDLICLDEESSRWVVTDKKVLVDGEQDLLSVLRFHEGWLEWCARNLRSIPKPLRYSSSDFISLDDRSLIKAKKILSKAFDEIYELSNQSGVDSNKVYGICLHLLQLIPHR